MMKWRRFTVAFCLLFALSWNPSAAGNLYAETDPFPLYESIQPNVDFWKKIYSEYSSRQGVIHDSKNLDIIYGVIDLRDPDQRGGRLVNRQRIKAAKSTYRSILEKLERSVQAGGLSPEEQRIADLFGPNAKPTDFHQARRRLRCQVGQKDRFRRGIIRSGAYLQNIREIFRDRGLPEDLAYLPHVESSFNPEAYSKFGAAGAWQFTRSTGRLYMTINYTIDERRDPIRSTQAAAKLLAHNYAKLKSWPLALTAYNHGLSGMVRAQKKYGDYEDVFKKHRSRTFKFASRNFYSEFLAARAVAADYQSHFGVLVLDSPPKTVEVTLPGYTSIPQLARRIDVDVDTMRRLNPALRNPVFTGLKYAPKGYRLRLPDNESRDWESLLAAVSEEIYKPDQKHSRLYQVGPGDTAGKIARFHGVSLQDLIAFNNLDSRATIYVDQNLRIPLPEDKATRTAVLEPPLSRQQSRTETDAIPAAKTTNPIEDLDAATQLLLAARIAAPQERASADTALDSAFLAEINPSAMAKSITPGDGADVSSITDTPVDDKEGALNSTVPGDAGPAMVMGSFSVDRIIEHRKRPVGIIRVEIEETLGHYAEWSGVRANEIRRLNGIRYGHPIHLGQELRIPLHRVTKEAFEETRFEYHKELVEDFFAAYRIETVQIYSIKKGDNIWTLSRDEFELPLWLIRRYNKEVDLAALVPTQSLRIPIVERAI